MSELRDLRVPGLGLAPMRPADDLGRGGMDARIPAWVRQPNRESLVFGLLACVRSAARRRPRTEPGAAPRMRPQAGFRLGHVAH